MRQSTLYSSSTILFLSILSHTAYSSRTVTFVNKCSYSVWPAGSGTDSTSSNIQGFALGSGQTQDVNVADTWNGRFWARTGCTFDSAGNGQCDTGDCGGLTCTTGGQIPTTLAEFNLQPTNTFSWYDISMVDGFNVPMQISPNTVSGGNCVSPTVSTDINSICPSNLAIKNSAGQTVACMSECTATGSAAACCTGSYNSQSSCQPTSTSEWFKQLAPTCYSYAWDSGTYECQSQDWTITLCPAGNAQPSTSTTTSQSNANTQPPTSTDNTTQQQQPAQSQQPVSSTTTSNTGPNTSTTVQTVVTTSVPGGAAIQSNQGPQQTVSRQIIKNPDGTITTITKTVDTQTTVVNQTPPPNKQVPQSKKNNVLQKLISLF